MAEDGARKGILTRLAEHPLGRLIFGFLLTGIIGQSLSWAYNERREKNGLRRDALASIREFSTLEEALRQRADQLRDAISRDAPPERIAARARTYYDASVAWGAALDANHLRFREFFGFSRRNYIEAAIEGGLTPILLSLDACLTDAELAVANDDRQGAKAVLDACGERGVDALLLSAHDCGYELSSTMTHFVMMGLECGDERWREEGRAVYEGLMNACGAPAAPRGTVWPYDSGRDEEYDNSCMRDDLWFDRLRP